MGPRLRWFWCAAVFVCFFISISAFAQQVSPRPLVTQPLDESQLTTLTGNTHPLAQPKFDIGVAPPDLPLNRMLLVLKRSPEQEHDLRALLDNQQDKASAAYHKWLTPDQFGAQFGPSDQDLQTITGWLQSHGFQINRISHGRTVIEFSGVESQVEEALHTSIHKYLVNGEEHWANASDPQIPTALAPVVVGVWTLHNFYKKPQLVIAEKQITAKYVPGHRPEFTSGGQNALAPADFSKIYNVTPYFGGFGPSIAIVGRSNINLQDVLYFHYWTDDQATSYQVLVNGLDPGDLGGGEEAEAVLDTTWSGAVAPEANVTLVVSASTNTTDGVDLSEEYIIDNNLSDVMSESFGDCEGDFASAEAAGIESLAEQAAVQGITYLVSSGDSGSAGCDNPDTETQATQGPSVNVLASPDAVVAVGGTVFNENGNNSKYWGTTDQTTLGSALGYIPEDVWNDSCTSSKCGSSKANIFASGGGASSFVQKPAWQTGVPGIPADGARDVPDVALTAAAHDPYLLCLDGSCVPNAQGEISFYGVGGTSASTPAFAGILSTVAARTGSRLGQPNYVLYRLAAAESLSSCNASNTTTLPSAACIFNDVTIGNNAVPGESSYGGSSPLYNSGTGYDLATGLGSVNATNLVQQWNSVTFNATSTTFAISPTNFVHGSAANVIVTVAANNGGVPTGAVWIEGGPRHGNLTGDDTSAILMLDPSGNVSSTTHVLPGGTYQVSAHYPGDGNYGPSDSSPPITITVQSESTTTTLSVLSGNSSSNLAPFTSAPYGTPVYLQAHVVGVSGYGTLTSYVNFWDSGSGIASNVYVDQDGNADPPKIATLPVGQHSFQAGYNGDSSFLPSTSATIAASIVQAATSLTVSGSPGTQGALLNGVINTQGYGNAPSGVVTFYVGGASVGTAPINTNTAPDGTTEGVATLTDAQLGTGQYTLSASYAGDTNYSGSASAPTAINVQPDFSIQSTTNALNIQTPGDSASMTISMTDLDGFSGTVSFTCSGLPSEAKCSFSPGSLSASASTNLTITTTAQTAMLRPGLSGYSSFTLAMFGVGICGLFVLGTPHRRRRRNLLLTVLLGAIWVGCGGSGSSGGGNTQPTPNPGTPTGNYAVTVTGTSGSTSHSIQFNLQIL